LGAAVKVADGLEWLLGLIAALILLVGWYLAFGIERRSHTSPPDSKTRTPGR